MPQPWEKYAQQGAPVAAPQDNPVIAPPDPYKQANEQRAQQDQALQEQNAAREAERLRIAQQDQQRQQAQFEGTGGIGSQNQQQIATLTTRIVGGLNDINTITKKDPGAQSPGFLEALRGDLMPGGITGMVTRASAGADRRTVADSQRDMLDAMLTLGTGAAYAKEQLDSQVAAYFPQYNDTPQEAAVKNQKMLRLIEAAKANAGPAWAKVEPALAPFMQQLQAQQQTDQQQGDPAFTPDGALNVHVTQDAPPAPQAPPPSPFVSSVGDIAQGFGDVVGIAGNPLNAAINAATGTNLSTDLGETLRTDILGIPHGNSTMEAINRFGTAAMTGSLGARGAATLANPGTVKNVLSVIGKTPIRDAFAGMGAGAGGEAGKASGIPGGELAGNALGGLAGYGVAGGANALANTVRSGAPNALARDAAHLGVDMLPADAGGPVAKAITTGAKASPFSVAPIVKASQGHQAQMAEAAGRIAESQGKVVTTDQAGLSIRNAAERYTKETAQRASRLYDRASEAAKGVLIKPTQTLAKLDEYIARVKNDPAAPDSAAAELQTFRDKIANGVNVAGLRDARTRLSQGVYDGKLRSGQDKGMWKDILGDLSTDIQSGLVASGKQDAASMFKTADAYWKGRVDHIDEVLQPVLGKGKGGEEVVKAVESMARGSSGGNARLSRLLANMKPEEAGQVRATIIDRIGKATPGAQSADGDAFSASTFLTNWNKMTPQAKGSLFSDGGLRKDLDALANLSEKMKQSQAMANHSNTGLGAMSNVGLQGAFALTHPVFAAIAIGGQYITGKLMASPGFARLLARTAKMPPEAAGRTLTQQLGVMAAREPLIANDARSLQQYLSQSLAQSPTRAAAQGQQENNGR
jgi:hypothetical protein